MNKQLLQRFNNKTILITGATGFVGGRLVELLAQDTTATIKVLVRDYGKAMRVGRYPIVFIKGELNDKTVVEEAVKDCDYVLHCAYGNKGSAEARNAVNVEGTAILLEAARKASALSLVFLSTVSVYGLPDTEWLDENSLSNPEKSDSYAISKLEAEKWVLDFAAKNNFHATVLQPTAVYGPWSPSYVIKPSEVLRNYKFPMIDGGKGICNAVYIDDLCQAMLLAATTTQAAGQKYIINGAEIITWLDFYQALAKLIPESELVSMNPEEMALLFKAAAYKKPVYKVLLKVISLNKDAVRELLQYKLFGNLATWALQNLPTKFLNKLRPIPKAHSTLRNKAVLPLDPSSVRFYKGTTKANSAKAFKELHYNPEFDLVKGFENIEKWGSWYWKNRQ